MKLSEFVSLVPGFDSLRPTEMIRIFAWHLHTYAGADAFGNAEMRDCFRQLNIADPNVAVYLPRMEKNGDLLHSSAGYRLARGIRTDLDQKYGQHPTAVMVSKLLSDLPAKVPDITERAFLDEALRCYKASAFRAAIVMAWNLAFDHLLRWILGDAGRLTAFNAAIPKRFPKKASTVIHKFDDFEELKESEMIEVLNSAGLVSTNVIKILKEKLDRRNICAHPSAVVVTQAQADDVVIDLVNNVMLAYI